MKGVVVRPAAASSFGREENCDAMPSMKALNASVRSASSLFEQMKAAPLTPAAKAAPRVPVEKVRRRAVRMVDEETVREMR